MCIGTMHIIFDSFSLLQFSSVFWNNLGELENWLLRLMASDIVTSTTNNILCNKSTRIPTVLFAGDGNFNQTIPTRSSSLTELSNWHTVDMILRQLQQLFLTVHSLSSFGTDYMKQRETKVRSTQTTAHTQTAVPTAEMCRHRDFLILAQEKAKEHWLSALPTPPVGRPVSGRGRVNLPLFMLPYPCVYHVQVFRYST